MYFSGHMLDGYSDAVSQIPHTEITELVSEKEEGDSGDGSDVTVVGIISKITKKTTKKGDAMAFISLEDRFAEIEILLFPKVFAKYSDLVVGDAAVSVTGTLSLREDEPPKILARDLCMLERNGVRKNPEPTAPRMSNMGGAFGSAAIMQAMRMAKEKNEQNIAKTVVRREPEKSSAAEPQSRKVDKLCIKVRSMDSVEAKKAENLIGIFCGGIRVLFFDESTKKYVALTNYGADACPALIRELKLLLGEDNVVLVYQPV
jgi:DNA polymerase III alpha subunit